MNYARTLLAGLLFTPLLALHALELKLLSLFTDHSVLQREKSLPVWGLTNPGEEVAVSFASQKKTAKADGAGKWRVNLDPLSASAEPRELRVGERVIRDVLVVDLGLCSGQSNRGFSVREAANAEQKIARARDPLRFDF